MQHGGRQRAAAAQTVLQMATEKVYLTADELNALAEENVTAAIDGVTPDWFDYLRQERIDFTNKFWEYYAELNFTSKHQVWAENFVIAFDQLFETAAMIYLKKQREWEPDTAAEEAIEKMMLVVFGDIRKAVPGPVDENSKAL